MIPELRTGVEHQREAEERLRASDYARQEDLMDCAMHEAAVAQVHATLALAAGVAEVDEPELVADAAASSIKRAAETVKATGGAVEIAGVRIEPCDTYGQTETTRRAEAAEAKVEAARKLAEATIAISDPIGTTPPPATLEVKWEREHAAQVAREFLAVLDPPEPKPPFKVVCWRCGELVASLRWTVGEGFDDTQHKLTETLAEHYETCPGAES